jgi:hypothetical protein
MTDKTTPAFPVSALVYNYDDKAPDTILHEGMTLRDYFAAKALPIAVNINVKQFTWEFGSEWYWNDEEDAAFAANVAYQLADAMLKAREQ